MNNSVESIFYYLKSKEESLSTYYRFYFLNQKTRKQGNKEKLFLCLCFHALAIK